MPFDEDAMGEQISDLVTGLLMALSGLLGLFLAARAVDSEMYLFGMSLAGFAVLFLFGLVRRHFDEAAALQIGSVHRD